MINGVRVKERQTLVWLVFAAVILLVLLSGNLASVMLADAGPAGNACAVTPELVAGQGGYAITGLGGYAITGLGGYAITGLSGGYAITGLGDLTDAELAALIQEIEANAVTPQWLLNLLPGITPGVNFNTMDVAILIVDDFGPTPTGDPSHGALVRQVFEDLEAAIVASVPELAGLKFHYYNVNIGDIGYQVDQITARIQAQVDALIVQGFEHFILNMSFALIPCEDPETGFSFTNFLQWRQQELSGEADTGGPWSVELTYTHPRNGKTGTYRITLTGVTEEANEQERWTYFVERIGGDIKLSHWNLIDLGSCQDHIVSTSPLASVGFDGTSGTTGVKWNVNNSFASGHFSILMDAQYPHGTVTALTAGGGAYASGDIRGPRCDPPPPPKLSLLDYLAMLGIDINELLGNLSEDDLSSLSNLLAFYMQKSLLDDNFAMIPVASAGNFAPLLGPNPLYPAALPSTIASSALLGGGAFWPASHNGNISTPGAWYPFGPNFFGAGTSFSGPGLGVLAALYLTFPDACTYDGVRPPLTALSLPLGNATFVSNGSELLNCVVKFAVPVAKYHDLNQSGTWDNDEPLLSGWQFFAYNGENGVVASATTGEAGIASLELPPGSYTVCEAQQVGWVNTDPNTGTHCKALIVSGGGNPGLIFGNYELPRGTLVIVKDRVPDGTTSFPFQVRQGETLIASPSVSEGSPATIEDLITGVYTVEEMFAGFGSGFRFGGAVCTDGSSIPADPSGNNTAVNVAIPPGETVTCTFTNQVRPTLTIYKVTDPAADPTVFTFTQNVRPTLPANFTLSHGEFQQYVEANAGTFTITEAVPAGWVLDSVACDGGVVTNLTNGIEITLDWGDAVSCTFYNSQDDVVEPPPPPPIPALEVTKYHDLNENGQWDAGEPLLAGWQFVVYNSAGVLVANGVTGPGGSISFNLPAGNYTVCEVLAEGWENSDPGELHPVYNLPCKEITVGGPSGPIELTMPTGNNKYSIEFLGTSNGGLTWSYRVNEVGNSQDLSHWVLELCMPLSAVVSWDPTASDPGIHQVSLGQDPTTGIGSGIKWDVGSNYDNSGGTKRDSRIFSFTLNQAFPVGTTRVAAKGPGGSGSTGLIAGPSCHSASLTFGNYEVQTEEIEEFAPEEFAPSESEVIYEDPAPEEEPANDPEESEVIYEDPAPEEEPANDPEESEVIYEDPAPEEEPDGGEEGEGDGE